MIQTLILMAVVFAAFYFVKPLLKTVGKHAGNDIAYHLGLDCRSGKDEKKKNVMVTKSTSKFNPQTGNYEKNVYIYTETSDQPPNLKLSMDKASNLQECQIWDKAE